MCGCSRQQPVGQSLIDSETPENVLFIEFLKAIPIQTPPIKLVCGLPDGPGSNNIIASDFAKYKEFIPTGYDAIFGTIGEKDNCYLVVFGQTSEDIYPTLFSFDKSGKVIDSLSLILSPCGAADEFQIPITVATIDKEFEIVLTDTIDYIHYPDHRSNYILDSTKTSIVIYHVNDHGQIVRK